MIPAFINRLILLYVLGEWAYLAFLCYVTLSFYWLGLTASMIGISQLSDH